MKCVKVICLTFAAIIMLAEPSLAKDDTTVCNFNKFSYFKISAKGDADVEIKNEEYKMVFTGLDSNNPKTTGSAGESNMIVLRKDSNTIWLVEPFAFGFLYYTLFPSQGIALVSKHVMLPQPYGWTTIGTCH